MSITLPDLEPRSAFTVGGTPTSNFVIPWAYFEDDEIKVLIDGVSTAGFSVSGTTGADNTGYVGATITLTTAVSNVEVVIYRDPPFDRTTSFQQTGPFNITQLERELDRNVSLSQVLEMLINRSLQIPMDEGSDGNYDAGGAAINNGPAGSEFATRAYVDAFDLNGTGGGAIRTETFTATASQTVFTTAQPYTTGINLIHIYVEGQLLPASRVTEDSTTQFTINPESALQNGDEVIAFIFEPISVGSLAASSVTYQGSNVDAFLDTWFGKTASETAAGVTPTNYGYRPGDVRRYGAVGDGTSDDTSAIQDALNANDKVFIPKTANYYKVTSEITVNTDNHLIGEGAFSKVTFDLSMATDNLFATTGTNVIIENLNMTGNITADASAPDDGNAVFASGGDRVHVRNCHVSAFPSGGIRFRNISNGTIIGNLVSTIQPATTAVGSIGGISVEDNCNTIKIHQNKVTLIGITNGQATGIRCIRQNSGVNNFPKHLSITDNDVSEIQCHGILMYAADAAPVDSLSSHISNNRVKNTGLATSGAANALGNGIYVVNVHSVTVANNYVESPCTNTGASSIARAGIAVMSTTTNTADNCNIIGNTVKNAGTDSIRAQALRYSNITGNTMDTWSVVNTGIALHLSVFQNGDGCHNVNVTGNTWVGNGAAEEHFQHGQSGAVPTSTNVFVEVYAPATTAQEEPLIRNYGTGCFVKSVATALPNSGDHAVGDVFINTAASPGEPAGWVCSVAGNPGTFVVSGQVGYRSGSTSPNGNVTPNFIGEEYLDSTANIWYKSYGSGISNWKAL